MSQSSLHQQHLHPSRSSLPLPYRGIRNSCRHSAQLTANIIALDRNDLVVPGEGDAPVGRLRRCGAIAEHSWGLELRQGRHVQYLEKKVKKLEMKQFLIKK